MPKLSIIVPVYKVEKYLRKCIDSILAQTFTDFELILVDDGSPDACPEICEEYKKLDNRIIVIHKCNGGLSDARNVGLDIAGGEYLGFIDSDDYVKSTMYQTLINVMNETFSDMVICDNYRVLSGEITVESWCERSESYNREDAMYQVLTDKIGSQAWNKLYKREMFGDIRYPIGQIYEDIATIYKYVHKCNRVEYIKVPLYYYTIRDDNISNSLNPKRDYDIFLGFKERYEFSKKEYPQFIDECLKLMVEHGLGICYHAILSGDAARFQDMYEYLASQKRYIFKSKKLALKRKGQAILLILSKKLYCNLIKCIQSVRRKRAGV